MKRIIIAFAAIAAAFCFVSCNKEQIDASSTDFKLNIKVANLDGSADTKAVKTKWESGDKINIWYIGNSQNDPDLVIRYDGSKWTKDVTAKVSGNEPKANGYLFYYYEGGNDLSKYSESDGMYYGAMNLLYEADVRNCGTYTYDGGTLNAEIKGWTPVSQFQVVVTDIDPSKYQLKCSNLLKFSGFGFSGGASINTEFAGYDAYVQCVENKDGAAFYFGSARDLSDRANYVFTLKNTETNEERAYIVSGKTHESQTLTAIKIDYSKFSVVCETEYVDLGLSVKWATMNVGAEKPEDYGYYFAWGETEEKELYSWSKEGDYKWGIYNSNAAPKYGMTKYTAFVEGGDRLLGLQPCDDPATVNWGPKWRTPTEGEFQELTDNSKCEWTWDDIKNGYTVKSLITGKSIFLPAAGYRYGSSSAYVGYLGNYWASSINAANPHNASLLVFSPEGYYCPTDYRYCGQPVRAVTK